jgi:glucokinase
MPLYAGFDIGGTNARMSLYDGSWQRLVEARRTIRGQTEPEQIAEAVREMLVAECGQVDVALDELTAVGIGLAGQLDKSGEMVVNAPNLGWRDEAFGELLRQTLEPELGEHNTRIVNDLNAILWGEYCDGAVAGVADVLAAYVGTGIGGAILCDGHLIDGAGGKAGEIGHSKVVPGGRLCGCGERGCVEAYAGGVHLESQVAEVAEREQIDALWRSGETVEVDLQEADRLVAQGHEAIEEIWERATDYLAIVLSNACTLLNPAVLLLGGGILSNLDEYRGRTLAKTTPLVLEAARDDLEIRTPQLGSDAGMIGAAKLAAGGSGS